MRSLVAVIGAFLTSACCSSLPKLASKRVAFPANAPAYERITASSEEWRDDARQRDVPVKLYAPANATERLPVVVFSHGIGENRGSYSYLGRALAHAGFLAIHVTHAGTDRAVLERGYRFLYRAVKQKENWVARPRDVSFVLDRIASRSDVDMNRVAVVGHSAGAFTAFAIAGMNTINGDGLKDDRVKVVIPMSMPRLDGVVAEGGYDTITIPVLNLTGTCDASLLYRTFPKHRRIPFDATHADRQYLVTLDGVNHDTFVVSDARNAQIAKITIAFLRAYLLDDKHSLAWFDDAGLGDVDGLRLSVERKKEIAK